MQSRYNCSASGRKNLKKAAADKNELFANVPVGKALFTLAVPTIISQLISLVYNMVDAFYIGRTGNSFMMAATTITLPVLLLNISFGNLFGIGGGSQVARKLGAGDPQSARKVSAFSFYGAIATGLAYSILVWIFLDPLLRFLGASDNTLRYAHSYGMIVVVIGTLPLLTQMVLSHLLRNSGYSTQASMGLSIGGILNMILDPIFMFVLLPKGMEVTGAAVATALSNTVGCIYLLIAYHRSSMEAPLSLDPAEARSIAKSDIGEVFSVGVPSAILTGLFDVANVCANMIAASHSDLVVAGMGIVMKIDRLPNAVNIGICQGMLPIVAFNYTSGNHVRMKAAISTARKAGLLISVICITVFEIFASPLSRMFLSTTAGDAATALATVAYASSFLRVRCLASPFQFINYSSSYCMQALGDGKSTMLHAFIRELVFYIPLMFLLDRILGEIGLAAALPVGEALGAMLALFLLQRSINRRSGKANA